MLLWRSESVLCVSFNLNSFSTPQVVTDFRFKLQEMKQIYDALGWSGATIRNRYICDPMVAGLATPNRWHDSKLKFGMFSAQMTEVFREQVELLVNKFGEKLELNGALLAMRAELYANGIRYAGAPLENCVGFIDCTQIRMLRPGACYSVMQTNASPHLSDTQYT